jgi:hypothetical protein
LTIYLRYDIINQENLCNGAVQTGGISSYIFAKLKGYFVCLAAQWQDIFCI